MTPNVEKMRHQLARRADEAEQTDRRQWLNTLTPEHRAAHERPNPLGVCGFCISENGRRLTEQLNQFSRHILAARERVAQRQQESRA